MVDVFTFPKQRQIQRGNVLLDATIRDFSGGWNVIDNDLNLSTKFSKILRNMQRANDGSNSVRPGTRLFADLSEHIDEIINVTYFNGVLICVGKNGKLVRVDSSGNVVLIWDDNFASSLPGSPDSWSITSFASFAEFNGSLIICNGVNKPLIVDGANSVQFLIDPATGSNTNTPIGRYVKTHERYLVIGGDPNDVDLIHISSTDTSGVFLGDDDPNDAVDVSLGSRVPSGSNVITGLGSFRNKLVISFENTILPGTLGVFDGDDHLPTFDEAIENHGSISHRTLQTIGEDMIFADHVGVSSVSRALFTGSVRPERFSQLIDPEIQKDLGHLQETATLVNNTFSVYDSLENNYMLFLPDEDKTTGINETRGFIFKKNETLKIEAWQEYTNWRWSCGTRSALKRIFFGRDDQLYVMGNSQDPITKDYEGDQEMWDDDTTWTDQTGWNPVADVNDSGVPIKFVWELPWSDADQRFLTKNSRFINFDTSGDQRFTCDMFTDNIYYDRTDPGETWQEDNLLWDDDLGWNVPTLDPTLSMAFEGGDAPGFGGDEFGEDFGGGRPTRLEKLVAWTAKYKLQKLRMSGDATKELKFISITLAYQQGSPRR